MVLTEVQYLLGVSGGRFRGVLKYLSGVAFNRLSGIRGVSVLRARGAHFFAATDERIYVQIDGEYAVEISPVTIGNVRRIN